MNSPHTYRPKRHKRGEKGEAEMMFFGIVLIICGIISGSLLILNWVKDTKNDRVDRQRDSHLAKGTPTPFSARPDPAAYWAHCQKPALALFQTSYKCEVLPESYGELDFLPNTGELNP